MAREVWDREIEYHDPPDFPDATIRRGADALAEHFEARLEALGQATVTVEAASWIGPSGLAATSGREGRALVELTLHSGGQSSGIRVDVPLFHIIQFRADRSTELREYLKREQAIEALGLSE